MEENESKGIKNTYGVFWEVQIGFKRVVTGREFCLNDWVTPPSSIWDPGRPWELWDQDRELHAALTGSKQLPEEWDKPHCFLPLFFLILPFVFSAYVKCDYLKIKIIISTQQSINEERWHTICVLQAASSQGNRPESSVTFNPYEPDGGHWTAERGERRPFSHSILLDEAVRAASLTMNWPHWKCSSVLLLQNSSLVVPILLKVHIFDTMFLQRCLCPLIYFSWVQQWVAQRTRTDVWAAGIVDMFRELWLYEAQGDY